MVTISKLHDSLMNKLFVARVTISRYCCLPLLGLQYLGTAVTRVTIFRYCHH